MGHPGSVHDQRVFKHSEVADFLNEREKFPFDSVILGDAAYEIHECLLTPFRDDGHLSNEQKKYNYHHASARVAVERCIGLLKGRMRSLLHCLPMQRVDLMATYIVACCVIHNICTSKGEEMAVITIPSSPDQNIRNQQRSLNIQERTQHNLGIIKRNSIMNKLGNLQ